MNTTNLAIVDIEADEIKKEPVNREMIERLSEGLALSAVRRPASLPEWQAEALASLVGKSFGSMSDGEVELLLRAASAVPMAAEADSFVWNAVKAPSDVERLKASVSAYRSFNPSAVELIEIVGENEDFKKFVRHFKPNPEIELQVVMNVERRQIDAISEFATKISDFTKVASGVFDTSSWTTAAVLSATGATAGLSHVRSILEPGWSLSVVPSGDILNKVEEGRFAFVSFAKSVKQSHGLDILGYSPAAVEGLRRGIFGEGTDFRAALAAFGVDEDREEALEVLASCFRGVFDASTRISEALSEAGLHATDFDAVMRLVVLRRYLKASAEALGVEWASVEGHFVPCAEVSAEKIAMFIEALGNESFSAKLESVSRDHSQSIGNVVTAAEQYVFAKRYWVNVGNRIVDVDPGIRMMDVSAALDMELELKTATREMRDAGAWKRSDVEELEAHLDWVMAVYGLPMSNDAVRTVMEGRGVPLFEVLTEPSSR